MPRLFIALSILCATASAQELHSFPTPARDNPVAAIEGALYRPQGGGPFPAVVLMHGCSGPASNGPAWAAYFVDKGFVALNVFGFRPRGIDEVCTKLPGKSGITLRDRAMDAFGGLAFLQSLPYVDSRRVVLMGFSHGGSTTLFAASGGFRRPFPGRPDFAAAIPFYPGCYEYDLDSIVPMLVVTGENDDWTPSRPCERKAERARAGGYDVRIAVMPGAHHGFDGRGPSYAGFYRSNVRNGSKPGGCCGATIAQSASATRRSEAEVAQFLATGLRPAGLQTATAPRSLAPSDEQIVGLVKRAVALHTAGTLVDAVNEHGGAFEANRFHVMVLDAEGKFLAHSRRPFVIGANAREARDAATGQTLGDRLRAALDAGGWGSYVLGRPVRLYAERAGDMMVVGVRYE